MITSGTRSRAPVAVALTLMALADPTLPAVWESRAASGERCRQWI
jgi:hypothetical protein